MPEYYKALDKNTDFSAVANAVRAVVKEMHDSGESYEKIAHRASEAVTREVTTTAVKIFLNRADGKRVNSNNQALPVLYDFIRADFHRLPPAAKSRALVEWTTLVPGNGDQAPQIETEAERALGLMCQNWLHVSDSEVRRLSDKVHGTYVMLRKSVHDPAVVVKSKLEIRKGNGRHSTIQVVHRHLDRHQKERKSSGFIVPVVRNIYGVLNVEKGEAIEILALKEPMQGDFERMMGFLISINMDRKILAARTFVERENKQWLGVKQRFRASDVANEKFLSERLRLLDDGKSMTTPDLVLEI